MVYYTIVFINVTRFRALCGFYAVQNKLICTYLSEKIHSIIFFQKQGDEQISSNHESAFPVAAVAVGVWSECPAVGDLLLAYFHRRCPYLVPYHVPKQPAQTSEQYYRCVECMHGMPNNSFFYAVKTIMSAVVAINVIVCFIYIYIMFL